MSFADDMILSETENKMTCKFIFFCSGFDKLSGETTRRKLNTYQEDTRLVAKPSSLLHSTYQMVLICCSTILAYDQL